jgi:hypothetical protein
MERFLFAARRIYFVLEQSDKAISSFGIETLLDTLLPTGIRSVMNFKIFFQQAMIIVLLGICGLHAQEFSCSGTLVFQIFGPGELTATNYFEVTVSGNKMLTLTSNVNSHACMQVALDDGVLYTLNSFPNGRAGTVKVGDFPDPNVNCADVFWLAYASSSYFQQVKTNQLRPIWMLDDPQLVKEGFTVKAEWSKSAQPPFLPKRVNYFNDGFYRHFTNGQRGTNSAPAPFDKGYTNAIYETFSVTNQSGLEIPSEFKFTRFYIWNKEELRPREITTARVTEFKTKISETNFRPRFSGSVDVVDLRFFFPDATKRSIHYKAKDGVWPTVKELQPVYEKELKIPRLQTAKPQPAS